LRAAVAAGFRVIVSADQSLPHQQNLPRLGQVIEVRPS